MAADDGTATLKQAGRAFITAPVMITYPVAYTLANIIWALSGAFRSGWADSTIVGILATLLVTMGILIVDLGTTEPEEETNFWVKMMFTFFNFVLLVGGVLHIEVPALDVAQP